jgi:hypothetical protein
MTVTAHAASAAVSAAGAVGAAGAAGAAGTAGTAGLATAGGTLAVATIAAPLILAVGGGIAIYGIYKMLNK